MKSENRPRVVNVDKCIYCGSTNIVRKIKISKTAEVGKIGLSYRSSLIVTGTEPIYADLCDDCGSLIRIYVVTPGKKWATE